MSEVTITPRIGDCWNRIGVRGDRSCPELAKVIHCHNCFVFASAGRVLLERAPDEIYRRTTARQYASEKSDDALRTLSIIVFRLGTEWFAILTRAFNEIAELTLIRKIPHRTSSILLGVTSVRGEIVLCASLAALLELKSSAIPSGQDARLLILSDGDTPWAVPSDEVEGLFHFPESRVREAPSTLSRSAAAYCRGVIEFDHGPVALIDEGVIFDALRRRLR